VRQGPYQPLVHPKIQFKDRQSTKFTGSISYTYHPTVSIIVSLFCQSYSFLREVLITADYYSFLPMPFIQHAKNNRCSITVKSGHKTEFCGQTPTICVFLFKCSSNGLPSTVTCPFSLLDCMKLFFSTLHCFTAPVKSDINVVFPHPLCPSKTNISFFSIVRFTPSKIVHTFSLDPFDLLLYACTKRRTQSQLFASIYACI
jgi:hypothetical protein